MPSCSFAPSILSFGWVLSSSHELPFTWPSVDGNQIFYSRFIRPPPVTGIYVTLDNLAWERSIATR